tara:strand:- start:349 stop:480 length:132 start_codon:yes stop_codon:yes gene_type:complete
VVNQLADKAAARSKARKTKSRTNCPASAYTAAYKLALSKFSLA